MSPPRLRLAATFLRLPAAEKLAVVRMAALAALVEAGLRAWTLERLAGRLGVRVHWSREPIAPRGELRLEPGERRDVLAVQRVMSHWPFVEATCLRQALLLAHTLRHRDPSVRIGVARGPAGITAHAWVEVGDVALAADESFLPLGRGESGP